MDEFAEAAEFDDTAALLFAALVPVVDGALELIYFDSIGGSGV